jgi:universal stress protein E
VWDFPAAHAIFRAAMDCKADLVVAESHRRSRLSRWFLANPDWELIRECPCPVWFVKTERLSRRPLVLVAVDPRHARAKPSNLDDRLLQAATALIGELDGRTALIHVEDKTGLSPVSQAETRAAVSRLATRYDIPAAAQTLLSGTPARVLARSAAAMSADVLVMGAVSRSGLRQAFIGSTAEAVIDEVSCDVLVVKPKGFRTSISRQAARLPGR